MEVGQFLLLPTYLFSDLLIFKIAFQIDMNDKVSDVQNKVKILEGSLFWIELSQNIASPPLGRRHRYIDIVLCCAFMLC